MEEPIALYCDGQHVKPGDRVEFEKGGALILIGHREVFTGQVSCIREYHSGAGGTRVKKYGVCIIEAGDILIRSEALRLIARGDLMPTKLQLARDIKESITQLARGETYPDLLAAVDQLAAMA